MANQNYMVPSASGSMTFLSSGSGVIPANAQQFRILGIGGGQSGAGGATIALSGSGGGGGGAGALVDSGWLPISLLLSAGGTLNYTVAIGAGGASAAAGAPGNTGGNTTVTFGSTVFSFFGASTTVATPGMSLTASTGGWGGSYPYIAFTNTPSYYFGGGAQGGTGSSATGVVPLAATTALLPTAGTAGGGLSSGTFEPGGAIAFASSATGSNHAAQATTAGENGFTGPSSSNWPITPPASGGTGGAGGGSGVTGGNGGAGGTPGAGGGGGGSGEAGGGTGGAGGNGALFIEWC